MSVKIYNKNNNRFNTDVLSIILYFLRYNRQSLYSCLFVNRLWCELTIPILWRNPWNFFYRLENTSSPSTQIQPIKLINTYLSLLPQELIIELQTNGINVPTYQIRSSFNYPSYIRGLDLNYLYKSILRWNDKYNEKHSTHPLQKVVTRLKKLGKKVTGRDNSMESDDEDKTKYDQINLICSKLLFLFFKESPKLSLIRIKPKKYEITFPLFEYLVKLGDTKNCLSHLTGLECVDDQNTKEIYTQLALNNTNISQIMIHGCQNTQSLADLISVQKKIQKLYIVNINRISPNEYWSTPGVGLELQRKTFFITKLKLEGSCGFLELLPDFINLEEFSLKCVHRNSCNSNRSARAPKLKNLKKIEFECDHKYEINFLALLIKNTRNLRKVIIEGERIEDPSNCNLLLDSIITCCPLLKNCSIPISTINPPLITLLKSCKDIQRLCLFSIPSENQINIDYCDNFLLQILKFEENNPANLHALELINCSFSVEVWEKFLCKTYEKNETNKIRKSVSYSWMEHNFQPSKEFIEKCSIYKSLGILKTYGNITLYKSGLSPQFNMRLD
ncbi:hypothetical protein RhiirA4_471082 [Rhizophagus irregularis]|uniref:F-box domain-containing protein n=1 Tax=Rhizophagus irregularis TaxID=588596 RepID=A0A2I1H2F8_9GLOM|nr:hypothetical protein RhiirA4_471082 [Rhizophagus irregularis]